MEARSSWLALGLRLVCTLGACLAAGASAQVPVPQGSEFRVNAYTTSSQFLPSVASDAAGDFVVVWNSAAQGGSGSRIFAQRYRSDATALGVELPVDSAGGSEQGIPVVSSDEDGDFVVVWEAGPTIAAQLFTSSGQPAGAQLDVSAPAKDPPRTPSVSSAANGDFVVVWTSGFAPEIRLFGRRYSSAGQPLGAEFSVPSYTSLQSWPSVSSDANGGFVVIWRGPTQDGDASDVVGRRYGSTGSPLGAEFRVNASTAGIQSYILVNPKTVSSDADGDFVVVWETLSPSGEGGEVFARRFGSNGQPRGADFQVNTYTTGRQVRPSISGGADGSFFVVWTSQGQDGGGDGVFGQRFGGGGQRLGPEFPVNSQTSGHQFVPSVGSGPDGDFVVVWTSLGQDGSAEGIFGRRFTAPSIDLRVTLADSADPVIAGTALSYSATVQNLGPQAASGLELRESLPPEVRFLSASAAGGGSCTESGGTVLCRLDELPPQGSAQVSVAVEVDLRATGPLQSTASVTAPAGYRLLDPNDDSDTEETLVTPVTLSSGPRGLQAALGCLLPIGAAVGLGLVRPARRKASLLVTAKAALPAWALLAAPCSRPRSLRALLAAPRSRPRSLRALLAAPRSRPTSTGAPDAKGNSP